MHSFAASSLHDDFVNLMRAQGLENMATEAGIMRNGTLLDVSTHNLDQQGSLHSDPTFRHSMNESHQPHFITKVHSHQASTLQARTVSDSFWLMIHLLKDLNVHFVQNVPYKEEKIRKSQQRITTFQHESLSKSRRKTRDFLQRSC